MGMRRLLAVSTILLAAGLAGCATSNAAGDDEQYASKGPPPCSQQDVAPWNMTITTCVEPFGPTTLPEEMRLRNPFVITTVRTPQGTFSNPAVWTVEVRRDGELIVERPFAQNEAAVAPDGADSMVEFRRAVPLTGEGELQPGTYEIRYRTEEGEELGTTTIEVPPSEADTSEADTESPEMREPEGGEEVPVEVPPTPDTQNPQDTMGD